MNADALVFKLRRCSNTVLVWLVFSRDGVPRTQKLLSTPQKRQVVKGFVFKSLEVGQNRVLHASRTARNPNCLLSAFKISICDSVFCLFPHRLTTTVLELGMWEGVRTFEGREVARGTANSEIIMGQPNRINSRLHSLFRRIFAFSPSGLLFIKDARRPFESAPPPLPYHYHHHHPHLSPSPSLSPAP